MEINDTMSTPGNHRAMIPTLSPLNAYMTSTDIIIDVTTENGNVTAQNGTFSRDENLAKIEIAVQFLILFLALFGNGIVLLVLCTRRKKLSRMNMMIVHLSLADLFVAFFNVLPQIAWDITFRFQGGDFLCRFVKYFQVVAMYASSYVLVSTAIDRYLAICHPLLTHTWTSKKMHALVGVAWILSLLFAVPQVTLFSYRMGHYGQYDCFDHFNPPFIIMRLYVTWITIAIYFIPLLLLSFAYGRICYVVWGSMRGREDTTRGTRTKNKDKVQNGGFSNISQVGHDGPNRPKGGATVPRAHSRGVSRAKVKTVKMTLTVIACYVLCWGPFFVAQMWAAWDPNAPFTGTAMVIILLLASLNSCTNPWIYLAFSSAACRQVLPCLGGKRRSDRTSATFDSESRLRSMYSRTEVSNLESVGITNEIPLLNKLENR